MQDEPKIMVRPAERDDGPRRGDHQRQGVTPAGDRDLDGVAINFSIASDATAI